MNLNLAQLIDSIPPEFTIKSQSLDFIIYQYKNKEIHVESWLNKQPFKIVYKEDNRYSRQFSDGPACQTFHRNGQLEHISYWKNGERHRPTTDGPAYEYWLANGQPGSIEYWENGKKVIIK